MRYRAEPRASRVPSRRWGTFEHARLLPRQSGAAALVGGTDRAVNLNPVLLVALVVDNEIPSITFE